MANRRFIQFFNTLHNKPVLLDCKFTVDSTNPLGITSLKGPGIEAVYMNSAAATPAGLNPAAGNIIVILQDNYNDSYGGFERVRAPLTGSELTSITAGNLYQITTLGSTLAQWQTAGLPVGITPALGVPFVAAASSIAGGGKVKAIGNSGIDSIEAVGVASTTLSSSLANIPGLQSGSYLAFQCLKSDVLTAPNDGSVIHLAMYLSNTRILNNGE